MDPLTVTLTGAIGGLFAFTAWLTRAYINDLKAGYDARLKDKDAQIVAWQAASQTDAKTSIESLQIAREMKATLERVEKEVRAGRTRKEG